MRSAAWFRTLSRRQQALVVAIVLAFVGQVAYSTIRAGKRLSDFSINREMGERFLSGEFLYNGGSNYNYMPVSGLFYAPIAMVPPWAGMLGRSLVGLAGLGLVFWCMSRMSPASGVSRFAAVVLSLALAMQFLQRDLDDGGPNLIYLAMIVSGGYAVWCGRTVFAGVSLGAAIALKMTPGLMLPFFLWKRQWCLTAVTLAATLMWIVLPAAWMGPSEWWRAQRSWFGVVEAVAGGQMNQGMIDNDLRIQNQSLKLALMHGLVTYPEGHPLRLGHADWSLLDMEPKLASRIVTLFLLAGFGAFCWFAVRPARVEVGEARWPYEWAGLLLAMLLLSPVTWAQHIVWAIPALYLAVTTSWPRRSLALGLMSAYTLLGVVLCRPLLGADLAYITQANHIHTLALLTLLGLMIWGARTSPQTQGEAHDLARNHALPRAA